MKMILLWKQAYIHGFWNELAAFTRSMFHAAFKTNPYMERGLMTGITRVSRESIFSDLNHLEIVTTTSEKYASSFGFTEKEVFRSLEECSLSEQKEAVKEWYDGFIFGKNSRSSFEADGRKAICICFDCKGYPGRKDL